MNGSGDDVGTVKVATRGELPRAARNWSRLTAGPSPCSTCDGAIYAIDDVCTHDGGPLAEGELTGCEIQCPRHGARFDVRTGRPLSHAGLRAGADHEVEVRGEDIFVVIQD